MDLIEAPSAPAIPLIDSIKVSVVPAILAIIPNKTPSDFDDLSKKTDHFTFIIPVTTSSITPLMPKAK